MIVQWQFLHKNHNFATHIPNLDVILHSNLGYMDIS
jgi:hypothetical protein